MLLFHSFVLPSLVSSQFSFSSYNSIFNLAMENFYAFHLVFLANLFVVWWRSTRCWCCRRIVLAEAVEALLWTYLYDRNFILKQSGLESISSLVVVVLFFSLVVLLLFLVEISIAFKWYFPVLYRSKSNYMFFIELSKY